MCQTALELGNAKLGVLPERKTAPYDPWTAEPCHSADASDPPTHGAATSAQKRYVAPLACAVERYKRVLVISAHVRRSLRPHARARSEQQPPHDPVGSARFPDLVCRRGVVGASARLPICLRLGVKTDAAVYPTRRRNLLSCRHLSGDGCTPRR